MKVFPKLLTFFLLLTVAATPAIGQNQRMSEAMASTVLTIWKDLLATDGKVDKWNYEQGVLLKGIEGVWFSTGEGKYFRYIQHLTDRFRKSTEKLRPCYANS